ncbi:MAG TPA: hypothetical protein DEB06_01730, partial [Phycisphaerales bacterium]|nr:hypothetical protein [Phycisphaerales bacterium]
MSPRVSVIVPLYNSGATVGETLGSLRAQSTESWEAIVVNDGSTDDGPAICEALAARDRRIGVVHQRNRGLGAARNSGIEHARGEFVHFLDADDTMRPGALERLSALAEGSAHGAAACGWERVGPAGEPLDWYEAPARGGFGLDELLAGNQAPVHALMMARRTLAGERFDESLPVVEDYDLWLRLAQRGVRWEISGAPLAVYRVRPESMSRATRVMWSTTRGVLMRAFARARASRVVVADTSAEREARTLSRLAFLHGTILAVRDAAGAGAILGEAPGDDWREPGFASRALHGGLALGLGLPPSAWRGDRSATLFHAARDWAGPALGAGAPGVFERLAALTVDPALVARALAERIAPPHPA